MFRNRLLFLSRIVTYDFSPVASQQIRRLVLSPLGILVLATAISALAGLVIHPRVFALSAGLLLVIAAGICWPWLTVRGVHATLRFPVQRVEEGHSIQVFASLQNALPWPAAGLGMTDMDQGSGIRFPVIPGRSATECRWIWVPSRRGEYPDTPPHLRTAFPFGLWEARRAFQVVSTLLVWPRTYPVGPTPRNAGEDTQDGPNPRNTAGNTGDMLGVRPYRRGDSPRRVHWAQSAKHDRLIVCELQSSTRCDVLLILDTDPAVHTSGVNGSREWAIRVAASLARGWIEFGARVGILFDQTMIPPQAGSDQITLIMDSLACLDSTGRPLSEVLKSRPWQSRPGIIQVVITTNQVESKSFCKLGANIRWVVLLQQGFREDSPAVSPEATAASTNLNGIRPWLCLPSPERIPHLLRYGTAEATHGF